MTYDHVILALGAVTNFHGGEGLERYALTMKTLGDAIHLRNQVIAHLEEADSECAAASRDLLVTFVVAGGGFAGVETMAAINDFVRQALRFYSHVKPEQVQMVLVHAGETILPELGAELGTYAQRKLRERGVTVLLNTRIVKAEENWVELSNGTRLETKTLVWTAGTAPNPLLACLPCEMERGRTCVNEYLEVPEWSGVWSLGDCANVPDPRTGKPYPPTAQHAIRQAKILAENLTAAVRGGKKRAFVFNTIGLMASLGRRTGVARVFGVNFSGFPAWFLWRTVYLSKLPRFEKKFRVALDWSLDLLFSKDIVQFLTLRSPLPKPMEEILRHRDAVVHASAAEPVPL